MMPVLNKKCKISVCIRQNKFVVMTSKKSFTKIFNFMTTAVIILMLGRCHIDYTVHYSFKTLLLPIIDQRNLFIVMMSKERGTKFVKNYDTWKRDSFVRYGHIVH